MPTVEEKAPAKPVIQHGDAAKLEDLKSQLGQVDALIPKEIVAGNDVSALRTRRASLIDAIDALEEVIKAYPFDRREREQAELRERVDVAFLTRRENGRRQMEAQAEADDLQTKLKAKLKEVDHWKFTAVDGVYSSNNALNRHVERFGDLSGS